MYKGIEHAMEGPKSSYKIEKQMFSTKDDLFTSKIKMIEACLENIS